MQRTHRFFASHCYALLAVCMLSFSLQASTPATPPAQPPSLLTMTAREVEAATGQSLSWKERLGLKVMQHRMRKALKQQGIAQTGPVAGCSKIILRNGDLIEATIIQVTTTEVKYKRCGKPNDPEFIQALKNVLSIKDETGDTIFDGTKYRVPGGTVSSPDEPRNDPMAVASLITGVSGLVLGLLLSGVIGILAGAVGIVLGAISLTRIKRNPDKYKGKSMAWAGFITGTVIVGLFLLLIALYL